MDKIDIPERALRLHAELEQRCKTAVSQIQTQIHVSWSQIRNTLDVPEGWELSTDGRAFVPPTTADGSAE